MGFARTLDLSALQWVSLIAGGMLSLLALIWMVVLIYHAFRISCNVKGRNAVIATIFILLIAEVFSKIGLNVVYDQFGLLTNT